jgi:hypothetical protein
MANINEPVLEVLNFLARNREYAIVRFHDKAVDDKRYYEGILQTCNSILGFIELTDKETFSHYKNEINQQLPSFL